MKAKRISLSVIVLVSCLTFAAYIFAKQEAKKKDDLYEQIELFASAVSLIKNDYVEEVDSKKLIYGALKGMLMSLDSHSQFLNPEDYKEMKEETEGRFGGLGIEITIKDDLLTIIAPIEGTPAFKAGLKPNDKIVRIDGKSTRDITLTEAVKKLRGEPGTKVALTILREEEKKILDVTVTRGLIKIESIKQARILKDNIGYIRLVEFQEDTPKDVVKNLKALKVKGMDSLIFDLRSNPGGLLDTSVKVAQIFLPQGKVVVSTKGRVRDQNVIYKANYKRPYLDFPVLVLVNGGSASASEIVAGAIKDNKRGIIVGAKTFGKGSVQTVIPLGDGSALRLTTAKYFTPEGRPIHNEGIMPDVVLPAAAAAKGEKEAKEELEEEEEDISEVKHDSQLERAIELLKGIKAYGALKAKE